VWQLGPDLTFVALGGEVVVDYVLRLKKELGRIWVAGYTNDVMAYIPSLRVLKEGGYEGGGAMVYYGLPAAWGPRVEDLIVAAVHERVNQVRAASTKKQQARTSSGHEDPNVEDPTAPAPKEKRYFGVLHKFD
jgi:hypothetical protein